MRIPGTRAERETVNALSVRWPPVILNVARRSRSAGLKTAPRRCMVSVVALLKCWNTNKKKVRLCLRSTPDSFLQTHKSKGKGSLDLPSTSLHHHHYPSTATATTAASTTAASMINLFILPIHALTHSSGRRPSPSLRLFLSSRPFFTSFSPPFSPFKLAAKKFLKGALKRQEWTSLKLAGK